MGGFSGWDVSIVWFDLPPAHSRASGNPRPRTGSPLSRERAGSRFEIFAREFNQRRVHLGGPLLLDPVAGAIEQDLALQVRHDAVHLVECALAHRASDHGVIGAGDEQRGLYDARPGPWHGQLPVAVDVAVPVQSAAETGAVVFAGEHRDVGFGQPRRKRDLTRRTEKSFRAIDIKAHLLFARRLAKADMEEPPQRERRIARELVLGGLLLEIQIIIVSLPGLAQRF